MTQFDTPYWNLSQAAGWVVYRERQLVEQLADPADGAFAAISMYPSMWPEGREEYGTPLDLHRALLDGRLRAEGYSKENPDQLSQIPGGYWHDLVLHAPCAYDRRHPGKRYEPWRDIRVKSSQVISLWPRPQDGEARRKFDEECLEQLCRRVLEEFPELSQNKKIDKIQGIYESELGGDAPSRTEFQTIIRGLG